MFSFPAAYTERGTIGGRMARKVLKDIFHLRECDLEAPDIDVATAWNESEEGALCST